MTSNERALMLPAGQIPPRLVGPLRLAIGFAQGVAAWLLLELVQPARIFDAPNPAPETFWSVRHPIAFAALALLTAFLPVIALAELGRMRRKRLVIYLAATAVVLGLLVAYDITRDPFDYGSLVPRVWPSAGLILCAGLGLFIANQLLEFRESGHRLYSHYAAHFEESWMRGFQFFLSLVFAGLVWGILQLGASLFGLIHVEWFGRMLEHNWFRCPVLAMAFAASVHITDIRPSLLRGMRNLGLTLLAWLLPLVVALGVAFLAALLVQGVQPLWETRSAATILLSAVWVTLFLLNAAYKDGLPEHAPAAVVRRAGRVAGPVMLILTALALWALSLRVGQYGWTMQRVRSTAAALIALGYSAGYVWAAFDRKSWLARLEKVNVTASFVVLAVLFALITPLADPARIAVSSQVARLHAGKTVPDRFDYQFLRFDTGTVGKDALAALAHDPNKDIADRARRAQASTERHWNGGEAPNPALTEAPFAHATIFPAGDSLPADFRNTDWKSRGTYQAQCLLDGSACAIFVLPGSMAGAATIIVHPGAPETATSAPMKKQGDGFAVATLLNEDDSAAVFARSITGEWNRIGTLANLRCPGVLAALQVGKVTPLRPRYDDLSAAGIRLEMAPDTSSDPDPCPTPPIKTTPTPKPGDASAPANLGPAFGNPGPG